MKVARKDIIAAIEGHGDASYVTRWPFSRYDITVKSLKTKRGWGWRILVKKCREG